ncbi:unnamed protein product [Larinioides sclopetarius]|uniref:Uncharacterized protein n=1 Tax=Larinioides sclopetarius TaxID=280406 RepID=A0AAV1Z0E0_9ARAC
MAKSETKLLLQSNNKNLLPPVFLAEFSNADLKFKKRHSLQFQSYRSSEKNALSNPKKMLVASTDKLQYVGSNFESEMSKVTSSLLKVGVYNRRTRQFKLHDADFFHLKPLLKCRVDVNNSQKSWSEKTQDLALTFGSKNRKRVISSRLKYESAANDTISHDKVQSSISSETTITEENKEECQIIPPQNKNANRVDEIYNIYDVIPKGDYDCLDTEAKIFMNVTRENLQLLRNDAKYCEFILHFLEVRFQNLSLHTAKLLCYLNYMTVLIKTTYKELKRKDPFPDIPQPYKSSLMEKYLVNRHLAQKYCRIT